jgi:hypothetical protein
MKDYRRDPRVVRAAHVRAFLSDDESDSWGRHRAEPLVRYEPAGLLETSQGNAFKCLSRG